MNSDSDKIIKTLDDIDALMMLMKKNKIDYAEIDGCKFTKSQHEEPIPPKAGDPSLEDDRRFWMNPLQPQN